MTPTYTPPGSRSTPAILALYVTIGACLLGVGADVRRVVVAGQLGRGEVAVDELLAADQLVTFAAVVGLVAVAVAGVLVARWWGVARGNLPALGEAGRPEPALLRGWQVAVLVAVVAVGVTWAAFGGADDVGDRQRIDALRAAASVLAAGAVGVTIAVVARTTARQEARAAAIGAPRGAASARPGDEAVSEGGLRVVSEERARDAEPGS